MTNPILNFDSDQSLSNPLKSETNVQAMIDASLLTGGVPTYNNATSYVTDDIVYYLGLFYIAPTNIASGGGTPLANTTWRQIENWGSYTTTASSAGTLTLTKYSSVIQRISGSTTHTIVLPVTSTLPALGKQYIVVNSSSGAVAIQSSGANAIATLTTNQYCILTCILLSGTTAASWVYTISGLTVGDALTTATLAQFASTTSAQLRGVISDETGTGVLVFADTPTLITPVLGVATATSINKVAITAPATSATITIANGKTFTANASITITGTDGKTLTLSNNLTFAGTDGTTMTFPSTNASVARLDAAQSFTGTQTFNNYIQLSENGGILMDQTLSADGKFSIAVGEISTLGETLSVGHLVYFKAADSRWWKCDSDADATSGPVKLGIVCVAGVAGEDCQIMLKGKIRADSLFPSFTVGAPVHIGATAGEMAVTAPTSGIVRVVGYGDTADTLYFNPDSYFYKLSSWTPTFAFGGGTTGITYSAQVGASIQISNKLSWTATVVLTSKGSSTGAFTLRGFPVSTSSTTNAFASAIFGETVAITYTGEKSAYMSTGATICNIEQVTEAGTTSVLTDANLTDSSQLIMSGYYFL